MVFFPPVALIGDVDVKIQLILHLIKNTLKEDLAELLFWNTTVDGKIIKAEIYHTGIQ